MDMSLSKLRETVKDREAWRDAVYGVSKSQTRLSNWTTTKSLGLEVACYSAATNRYSQEKWFLISAFPHNPSLFLPKDSPPLFPLELLSPAIFPTTFLFLLFIIWSLQSHCMWTCRSPLRIENAIWIHMKRLFFFFSTEKHIMQGLIVCARSDDWTCPGEGSPPSITACSSIGNSGTVCAAHWEQSNLGLGAFQWAAQRQKGGRKLPAFPFLVHRLQVGCVSCLYPDE